MSIWEILNNKWSHLGKIKKIVEILEKIRYHNPMKLEKILINRKHEMFWNFELHCQLFFAFLLTVNMKCFEIENSKHINIVYSTLTVNMKCFEIFYDRSWVRICIILTVNMKCFEIHLNNHQ